MSMFSMTGPHGGMLIKAVAPMAGAGGTQTKNPEHGFFRTIVNFIDPEGAMPFKAERQASEIFGAAARRLQAHGATPEQAVDLLDSKIGRLWGEQIAEASRNVDRDPGDIAAGKHDGSLYNLVTGPMSPAGMLPRKVISKLESGAASVEQAVPPGSGNGFADTGTAESPQPARDPRFDAAVTPQIDARAASIYEALGKSPSKAVAFAGRLAEDVNWHSMAEVLLPKDGDRSAIPSGLVSSTSQALDWGVNDAAAVMSSLLRLAGKHDRAVQVESKAITDMPEAFPAVEPPPKPAPAPKDGMTREQLEQGLRKDEASLAQAQRDLKTLESGGKVPNLTPEGARSTIEGATAAIQNKRALLAKFKGEQAAPPAPTPAPSAEAPRAADAAEAPGAQPVQHSIAVGPRGGRYVAGSEKRDAKGRKIRRYIGKDEPGTGRQAAKDDPRYRRWSEDVRVRGGRDRRLPTAGTEMTRYFKGQAVKVSEGADGQFHVHLDGQHAASGRSLTGALSKALGRAVSGYGFMRLGGAQEGPAVKDWNAVARAKNHLLSVADGVAPFGVKTAEHFKDGVRVHVRHGDDHYLIEGDASGNIRETGGKQHLWKVDGNRYVRVDQIGGKGAGGAAESDKAAEQSRPEPRAAASVADRIQSDPIGLAADVQALEAMSEPELKALDQAIYERGRRMSRSGDYTSEQVSANDDASLAVAKRLSEIANRRAAEPNKPATDSTGFTTESDAKHGVMPAKELAAHLAEHGFHDPVAAQGFVEMIDEYGDKMGPWSEAMKHDPSTVMAAARFQPGDVVLPIGPADEDAAYESALRHGTYKKLWPTATYDPTTDTITRTIAGQTETKPVHEFVSELRGHKIGRKYAHDASEASFATHGGSTPYRVESVGKDGMLTIRGVHGHGQNKTFKIHPDIGKMARYADERMERIMAAFDAGRIDLDGEGKGNPRSLSPEARNALRKMPAADLEALAPDASAAALATKGKESPHQKRLNKVVSSLTKHARNLANFGVKGSELEIRIHPDAVVLAHKDTGEQFAAVEHDLPVTEPDAIAAKRAGLANVSNIRHVATPHFGTEKSRRDWSYVEDGILALHDYAFRRQAPQPPEGFEAVIFDHDRDEWMAVKSLDLAGLGDDSDADADRPRLPLL